MCSINDIRSFALRAIKTVLIVVGLLLPIETLWAVPVSCNANPDNISGIIRYNTSGTTNTYCELCGVGQVHIIVTNPTNKDMANFVIQHTFDSNELEYVPGSTNSGADGDPTITGGGTVLTWTSAQISGLTQIDGVNNSNYNTVDIVFNVRSRTGTEENLVNIDRDIRVTADYNLCLSTTNNPGTVSYGKIQLPIHEPIPSVTKLGRNVDSNQGTGSYTSTVYGNIDDDVIWRIQVANSGLADLQDLRFDDLMQNGNFQINYACPTEGEASTIAAADGAGPVGNCTNAGNTISNFGVDDPFGNPANDEPGRYVDVPASGNTFIYLVGKVTNSCTANRTNTVDDVQWGCEIDSGDGGITQTSTNSSPGSSTTTMSSLVNNNGLQITRALTGLNTNQPVGSRGLMTLTVRNVSGGSVKNLVLTNTLPVEYVVDSSFTPTMVVTTPYGNYPGLVDTLGVSATPADPLDFKAPVFTLTSSTVHPDHAEQLNMLRHGDMAVIRFRVVMIPTSHFDNKADIDIRTEDTPDTTDPVNAHNTSGDFLDNQLDITFNNFCNATQQSLTFNDTFDSEPEDLDIDITGNELIFILTNDPNQALPLQVTVTNNGGHYADDYTAYVSFGATMEVTSAPAGCSVTTNPPLLEVWEDPVDIPANATVYICDHTSLGTIAPGAQEVLDFQVIKTSDAGRLALDDLSFRADVIGEIALSNNTLTGSGALLTFPTVQTTPINNRANNYSLDAVRARVIGFNLTKEQLGECSENIPNPLPASPGALVQIGEECTVHIESGGWFGFQTPGFTYIAVENVQVIDQLPNGQGYISSTDPVAASDPEVKGFTLNPPPTPLDEGFFNWTFNTETPAERILVKDKWFRVNATTRILNDPIDSRASPNVHAAQSRNIMNSTFDAIFNNATTGNDETFNLGPNTVGYPNESIRRVDLTVTEPNILVTKEVCNETLYTSGTGCTEFHPTINDGDTKDSYIYKITLTNQASSSSIARAPAYNVTTTDTLDATDLVRIVDFASDGLDNDGDGLIDGADGNGEGTISENNVFDPPAFPTAIPAVITTSHTHSSALLKINPGASVTYYYRVDPDDSVAPLQTLTNAISASYDSMENVSGNQTVVLGTNSTPGGARVYTSATSNATIQILPLTTVPKTITRLANSSISGGQPQPVSIGEEIEYELKTSIPVADLDDFYISDELPAGISCSEAPDVNLNAGGPHDAAGFFPGGIITPTCNDNLVYWYFGNQELTKNTSGNSLYEFAVKFIARVDNTAGVNDTNIISNGNPSTNTFLSYDNDAGIQVRLDFSKFDIRVHEPKITLTKTYESVTNDAGDIITVTVTATNTDTVATAYNLRVFDDLDAVSNLSFLNNVAGTDPPDNVDIVTFGDNRPVFSWNVDGPGYAKYSIPPGATKSFTFDIRVEPGAQPHEILNNTIQASWQSLPTQSKSLNTSGLIGVDGSVTGMRNGTIPNTPADLINDYETTASALSTVPALTMTKSDLDNTQAVEVGVHKNYEIVINLPEGITNNLVVNDNLNFSGLSYVLENNADYDVTYTFSGIASVNGDVTPDEASLIAFAADATTGTAVWNFGTVITTTEDDTAGVPAISPRITISYYARVNNDTNTNTGSTLQNQVTTNYSNGETPTTTQALIDTTPVLTVTESVLTVSKTATLITAAPITGGDIIEYVVTIPNSGNATAYDLNIVDTLPSNLGLYSGFTPTAKINGVDVVGFNSTPSGSPNGPLIWGKGNSDNSLDLPAVVANPLVLTYRVIVEAGAESNITYTNNVIVDWTSLDDTVANSVTYERTGAGCPAIVAPNDYCTGPATSSITTIDTSTLTKSVILDTYAPTNDATVRIGDTVTYQLSLNLQEGTTRSVNVQDVLPTGLAFVDIVSINGDTVANYDPPGAGSGSNFSYSTILSASLPTAGATGTINFPIGNVVNDPAGDATTDSLLIVYRARVLENTLTHTPTTTLTNTATLQYIDGNNAAVVDPTRLQNTSDVTVLQPVLTTPTKIDRSGRTSIANVQVGIDTMNFRLESCNTAGLTPAYNVKLTDSLDTELDEASITIPVVTINGVLGVAGVDYTYTAPAARGGFMQFDLITAVNPNQCVRIDYDIGIHNDFAVNTLWYNAVTVNEYWSLPAKLGQQYAALGPIQFGMFNNDPFVPPTKVMLTPVNDEATIGDEVVYQITIPMSNGARHDVDITDTLHPSLEYISATEVSGNLFTLVDTTTPPGGVKLGISYIPANKEAIIQVRARVVNNINANAGVAFTNTAQYNYSNSSGGATIFGGAITTADSLKIVEPTVVLAKTVTNTTNVGNPPNAGDILRYSLTFTASGGVANDNFSDAFDVSVVDTLSLGLAYQSATSTVTVAGNTISDPTIVGDGIATGQTLTWSLANATANIDIVEGSVVTVTYDVVVLNTVLANQDLVNSAVIQWTGIDGANVLERTGTATPVLNDYFTAPVTTTLTTPDNTVLTKTRVTDTFGAGDANVRIGDIIEFQLSVTLVEGLTNNLVLTDTLPQGLSFETVTYINGDTSSPYSAVTPFVHNDITAVTVGNPVAGASTVTFTLGNVTNTADNNAANDNFIIRYRARVLDNVHSQVNAKTLTNTALLTYITASGAANSDSSVNLTLLQPTLNVTKTAVAEGGVTVADPTNTILAPNELVTYTVNVENTGLAPAYDLVLDDVIPVGMRNGAATITTLSTTILPATNLTNITPSYNSATGLAIWDFDSGTAEAYNIDVGETLQIIYQVQADSDIGAGQTLTNSAVAKLYYSFDDDAVPEISGATGVREIYGPSNAATTTLTTAAPGVLLKENPTNTNVTIGETFTYKITVPEVPVDTYLHDVRVTDNLVASAAGLTFVSATKVSGSQTWTPTNTGTSTNLIIEDTSNGIDIPPNEQVEINIIVLVTDNATKNVIGRTFINTATYTYNQVADDNTSQANGMAGSTVNMTIIEPDNLTLVKTGPGSINIGTAETFTLNIQNTGTSSAWDMTIVDALPTFDPAAGGMCETVPTNIVAQMYLADGITTVGAALVQGTDYVVNYTGCTLTLTMQTATAALASTNRLIITYDAELDSDTPHGTSLTNYAWVSQWFSLDTSGAGSTDETRTYTRALSTTPNQGTVGTLDHEDAYTVSSDSPIVTVEKSVFNVTTNASGDNASPGDLLRYSIKITNTSAVELYNFSFTDDLDALNGSARFVAGSLNLTTVPAGADVSNTDINGGSKGTGLVDIRNLTLGVAPAVITIEFEVRIAASIPDATIVYNQGHMLTNGLDFPSDKPVIGGAAEPTETLINSAPSFKVEKTSTDLTGDPNILLSGDTLRYTITVKNIGTEDAINTYLRDQLPANTTYVAGSTILNGNAVAEPIPGTLPLQSAIIINAPENTTSGVMRADATATTTNVAKIIFDVTIDANVVNGTIISNQAYVSASGVASGAMADTPSDDPGTPTIPNDPTRDVVGNQPLVDAHKTVSIYVDNNNDGFLDPGDILRYTITVSNIGATPATGVSFVDAIPANTTYIADSVTLNTLAVGQPDAGVSPLIAGIPVSSSDLTPALPTIGNGILSPGTNAVITFDVQVNAAVPGGTVISNQGNVYTNELPVEPTDADGIDSNGDQPTLIVVGNGQLLTITKSVSVVGGGPVVAGGQLEYRILVTNISAVDATNVTITDNLNLPVAGQLTYVLNSGLLNGLPAGVSYANPIITADYDAPYGNLPSGQTAELVFRVDVNNALAIGTTITNTATVYWNAATQTDSATISVDVGGTPGVANVNGKVWHDNNYNNTPDIGEVELSNWYVDIYRNTTLLGTVTTDANGNYSINGLTPNYIGPDRYDIRFRAPGSNATTAKLGFANSTPALGYTDALHRIYNIVLNPGANVQNLNLPIDPNGVVYNTVTRAAISGATISLLNATSGIELSSNCFDDVNQQNQITTANGYYKFDLNFSQADCIAGNNYLIRITSPAADFSLLPSTVITPQTDATTAAFNVPNCAGTADDDVAAPAGICEVQASELAPVLAIAPASAGTSYYLHLTLDDVDVPGDSQIFNNHLPIDPLLKNAVSITKTSAFVNVTRGKLVPYTITFTNTLPVDLNNSNIVDNFPVGFKYIVGSARYNNGTTEVQLEPVRNGLTLTWPNISLPVGTTQTIKLLLIVGSGVKEGPYSNKAHVFDTLTNTQASGTAVATVRVTADPDFDCSDVIGKVYDDKNLNGYQDKGEKGLSGVKLITVRGLVSTSDKHGRFHVTCAVVPNEDRGSNFVIKLDERTLPSGYRMTSENPRVQRVTRGKMAKFNFGSAIHRVVSMDLADGVFVSNSTDMNTQWIPRLDLLINQLKEKPSVLRLSYLADVDDENIVEDRLEKVKQIIIDKWLVEDKYKLTVETEVFWRRGGPPDRGGID